MYFCISYFNFIYNREGIFRIGGSWNLKIFVRRVLLIDIIFLNFSLLRFDVEVVRYVKDRFINIFLCLFLSCLSNVEIFFCSVVCRIYLFIGVYDFYMRIFLKISFIYRGRLYVWKVF